MRQTLGSSPGRVVGRLERSQDWGSTVGGKVSCQVSARDRGACPRFVPSSCLPPAPYDLGQRPSFSASVSPPWSPSWHQYCMILLQDPGAWGPSHLAARSLVLSSLLCSCGVGAGQGAGRKGPTPTLVPVAADLGQRQVILRWGKGEPGAKGRRSPQRARCDRAGAGGGKGRAGGGGGERRGGGRAGEAGSAASAAQSKRESERASEQGRRREPERLAGRPRRRAD